MEKPEPRDLAVIQNPLIKTEENLEEIARLVDSENFKWGSIFEGVYCPSMPGGIYWVLRSLGESVGIKPDLTFCDIGFGSGTVLATFAVLGYKTYGIDMREQPLRHAPAFFDRVQGRFGKFKHKPQLILGEIKHGEVAEFSFPDGRVIGDIDLYYAHINNEPDSMPELMKSISPKKGSIAIHPDGYFHTSKRLEQLAQTYCEQGWGRLREIPTYDSLGFTLVNKDKQNLGPYEKDGSGVMQSAYSALFLKE
ncbi:MAG: hypothetical protein Q8L27_01640 [archaeon]|nr:hypothetical protein [archaeon]